MLYEHKKVVFRPSVGRRLDNVLTQSASVAHHALLKEFAENRKPSFFFLQRQDLTDISPGWLSVLEMNFLDIIILGTGGSSLGGGGGAFEGSILTPRFSLLMDNIDPHTFTVLSHRLLN